MSQTAEMKMNNRQLLLAAYILAVPLDKDPMDQFNEDVMELDFLRKNDPNIRQKVADQTRPIIRASQLVAAQEDR